MDELGQIAKDRHPGLPNVPDAGGRHGAIAEMGWRYKRAVFEGYDGQLYRVTISVAQGRQGKTLYNIGRVEPVGNKKTGTTVGGSSGSAGASVVRSGSGDTSVTQNASGVNAYSTQNGLQYDIAPRSHYDYSKPFAQQVEDWMNGQIPKGDALLVGRTPEIYRKIGLSDLPMTIDQRHMDYAVNGTKEDHQMSMEMLAHLPELLSDPIAIIESATRPNDSVVALVDATINGKL